MTKYIETKEQLTAVLKAKEEVFIISSTLALYARELATKKDVPLALPQNTDDKEMPLADATMYAKKAGLTVRTALQLARFIGVANFIQLLVNYKISLRASDGTQLLVQKNQN